MGLLGLRTEDDDLLAGCVDPAAAAVGMLVDDATLQDCIRHLPLVRMVLGCLIKILSYVGSIDFCFDVFELLLKHKLMGKLLINTGLHLRCPCDPRGVSVVGLEVVLHQVVARRCRLVGERQV